MHILTALNLLTKNSVPAQLTNRSRILRSETGPNKTISVLFSPSQYGSRWDNTRSSTSAKIKNGMGCIWKNLVYWPTIDVNSCLIQISLGHIAPEKIFKLSLFMREVPYQITANGDVILDQCINRPLFKKETITTVMQKIIPKWSRIIFILRNDHFGTILLWEDRPFSLLSTSTTTAKYDVRRSELFQETNSIHSCCFTNVLGDICCYE